MMVFGCGRKSSILLLHGNVTATCLTLWLELSKGSFFYGTLSEEYLEPFLRTMASPSSGSNPRQHYIIKRLNVDEILLRQFWISSHACLYINPLVSIIYKKILSKLQHGYKIRKMDSIILLPQEKTRTSWSAYNYPTILPRMEGDKTI